MFTKVKNFFSEVKVELQKASWPWEPKEKGIRRYKELTDSTMVVIIAGTARQMGLEIVD
jgi:preprotein translocase subunit SecE